MSKGLYVVEETIRYEIFADNATDAYDIIADSPNRHAYLVGVTNRVMVDGPSGWREELGGDDNRGDDEVRIG